MGAAKMIRQPGELIEPIREAVDRKAVIFSHLLLAVTITVHTVLDPRSYDYQIALGVGISVAALALAYLRFFDLARVNSKPRLYIAAYCLIMFLGFAFISDPATPYALGFFLAVFLANLYYGHSGVWTIVMILGIASLAKFAFLFTTTDINILDNLNIVATFLVFLSICSIFINIQKVYDWDRARLNDALKVSAVERERLKTLINNMTESVMVLNRNGVIGLYNAATLGLFNTNESPTGKSPEDFITLENDKGERIHANELLPSGSLPLSRNDIVIRYGKDDTASLSVTVTPLHTSFGQNEEDTNYIMTMRDITREKSLEDERREFISVISHELRTPVAIIEASIANSIMITEKNGDAKAVSKALKTVHDQSLYLANMLNDLSTFARAEQNQLDLNLEEVNPMELLNRLRDDYAGEAESKGLTIKTTVDKDTLPVIISNKLYLREILQNFLTNSLKYSDKGVITIKAEPAPEGIKFSVSDQGIGISTSDQSKVFNKFFRAEDFRTRSTGGTGLGLYIVHKLSKLLKAELSLESTVGEGSTFILTAPDLSQQLNDAHAKLIATNISDPSAAADGHETVVLEDNPA